MYQPYLDMDEAQKFLELMVSHDTTFRKSPTLPLVKKVAAILTAKGIDVQIIPSKENPLEHASLFATLGPKNVDGGVMLSGHFDVVAANPEEWEDTPPFQLTETPEKFIGRGTTDMKGFNSLAMAALTGWSPAAHEFTTPVHLCFTHDEEGGFQAIQEAMAEIGKTLPKPRLAIVGEGTEMEVVTAHKGSLRCQFNIEGVEGHSAYPKSAVNPLKVMTTLFARAGLRNDEFEQAAKASANPDFHSTLEPTVGRAGSMDAKNIIPGHAEVMIHARPVSMQDRDAILAWGNDLAAELPGLHKNQITGVTPVVNFSYSSVPPLEGEQPNPAFEFASGLLGTRGNPGKKVSYATEASYIQQAGIPVVVCGPGSIEADAHKIKESLARSQYEKAGGFLNRVMQAARAGLG